MRTTSTYRCTGCNRRIKAPEGLCSSCFRELKALMTEEKQGKKKKKKKK